MDYLNPFGMVQNQNAVPSNPFWSGMVGQRNQANAYPFMQNSFQSQGLDLQKQAMEVGEFTSPLAQESRRTGLEEGIATKRSNMEILPFKTEHERKRYLEEIRALPALTDEKIARAGEVVRNVKAAPQRELLANLGTLYDMMHKLPDDSGPDGSMKNPQRAQTYLREVARFRMQNPGIDIPPQLRTYDPDNTMADLAAIRFNQLNSPEQVGKERIENIRGDYKLRDSELDNASRERQVAGTNAATRYAADKAAERAAANETPAKAIARLKKEIRENPKDQEAQDELHGYLQTEFSKYLKERPEKGALDIMYMQGMNDPKSQVQYFERMQQLEGDFYERHGIKIPQYEYRLNGGKVQRKLKGSK